MRLGFHQLWGERGKDNQGAEEKKGKMSGGKKKKIKKRAKKHVPTLFREVTIDKILGWRHHLSTLYIYHEWD